MLTKFKIYRPSNVVRFYTNCKFNPSNISQGKEKYNLFEKNENVIKSKSYDGFISNLIPNVLKH